MSKLELELELECVRNELKQANELLDLLRDDEKKALKDKQEELDDCRLDFYEYRRVCFELSECNAQLYKYSKELAECKEELKN